MIKNKASGRIPSEWKVGRGDKNRRRTKYETYKIWFIILKQTKRRFQHGNRRARFVFLDLEKAFNRTPKRKI